MVHWQTGVVLGVLQVVVNFSLNEVSSLSTLTALLFDFREALILASGIKQQTARNNLKEKNTLIRN
jgi:hypothetical protein